MSMIFSSVTGICLLSIAVSVCLLICPDSSMKKQIRFLIALLFILILIRPVREFQIPESLEAIQKTQSDQTAQALTEQAVKNTILELLSENQISCSEISVNLHIDENDCISITDVSLTCDDMHNAVRLLREMLSEEVTLHVSEILE